MSIEKEIARLLQTDKRFKSISEAVLMTVIPEALAGLATTARARRHSPTPRPAFVSKDLSESLCPPSIK